MLSECDLIFLIKSSNIFLWRTVPSVQLLNQKSVLLVRGHGANLQCLQHFSDVYTFSISVCLCVLFLIHFQLEFRSISGAI